MHFFWFQFVDVFKLKFVGPKQRKYGRQYKLNFEENFVLHSGKLLLWAEIDRFTGPDDVSSSMRARNFGLKKTDYK